MSLPAASSTFDSDSASPLSPAEAHAPLRVLTPFGHEMQAALTHAARFLTRFMQRELPAPPDFACR
jgi:hypothetical protein